MDGAVESCCSKAVFAKKGDAVTDLTFSHYEIVYRPTEAGVVSPILLIPLDADVVEVKRGETPFERGDDYVASDGQTYATWILRSDP